MSPTCALNYQKSRPVTSILGPVAGVTHTAMDPRFGHVERSTWGGRDIGFFKKRL